MRKIVLFFWSCFLWNLSAIAEESLIPRSVLFGNPTIAQVRLSPDGQYISYLAPKEGVLNLYVAKTGDLDSAKVVTNDTDRGIRNYFWSYNSEHLLYLQDFKGDENFRLYSYGLKTEENKLLTPERDVATRMYGMSVDKPNELLIGLNQRDARYFDVYRLNLANSSLDLVLENDQFSQIIVDNNLNLRLAVQVDANGNEEVFQRKDNAWALWMKIPMEDAMNTGILGFTQDNRSIYMMDSRSTDTAVLKEIDLKKGSEKILAQDPKADIDVFTRHPTNKTIQAIEVDYEKPIVHVLDPKIGKDIAFLQAHNGGYFSIVSRTLNDAKWIVAYANDMMPAEYFLYDRKSGKAEFLFSSNPELAKSPLAPMHSLVLKARDGLNLVSYLTLPNGVTKKSLAPNAPLPLILYVHGGPWARDDWGLNSAHQWLANRGYAVLSVNYRGSTGFGKAFVNAGNLEWSGKMHDDLIDSVQWAIKQGIADPQKVAIMGGSYGGYATLVGMTFTPEVFACGIDIVGPSNLLTLCQSVPPYWLPIINDFKKRVGNWETEEGIKELEARSPLTYADKIQKPLLIAQGAYDPRVKQAEADQIVDMMQKKQIPVLYALYPSEGHGFAKPNNRRSFFAIAEQFFASVLGGRSEPIGVDFQGADFVLNGQKDPDASAATALIYEHTKIEPAATAQNEI